MNVYCDSIRNRLNIYYLKFNYIATKGVIYLIDSSGRLCVICPVHNYDKSYWNFTSSQGTLNTLSLLKAILNAVRMSL